MRVIRFLGLGVVCAVLAAGCANQPSAQVCASGIVCPEGTTCAAVQAVCIVGSCGNGLTDPGETCDDGNIVDGDGCSHACKGEMCGNGDMDPGEKCDDGNVTDGDGCSADCKSVEVCGNGIKDVRELCDDGGTVSGDGCSSDCKSTEICGNGIKDIRELCDDKNAPGGCSDDCQGGIGCGDGQIDRDADGKPIEECDDGNAADDDDCNDCHISICGDHVIQTTGVRHEDCDPGANGVSLQTADCNIDCTAATCGDGKVNPLNQSAGATSVGEQCDDANAVNGDTCDTNCTRPACGNKITDPNEACDDGNLVNGDACDNNCTVPACGNGIKNTNEACDDGNRVDDDGCSAACVVERCGDNVRNNREACDTNGNSQTCNADCTLAECGDGKINQSFTPMSALGGEQCDDDNTDNNDGCSATCQFEFCGDGITNNQEPCDDKGNSLRCNADCTMPRCGDGKTNPLFKPDGTRGEQCDVGAFVSNDGCSNTCQFERCGNGIVDPGEQCDGTGDGTFACSACHLVKCGDGIVDEAFGELCDDGNSSAQDDCLSNDPDPAKCVAAKCGDGVKNSLREQCDNGQTPGNGCSAACQLIKCGNGILETGEQCDDHNEANNDDCLSDGLTPATQCKLARCGDGVRQTVGEIEDCDDGANNGPGKSCSNDCHLQGCGNGIIDVGEACDDGNNLSCGGCDQGCLLVTPPQAASGLIIIPAGADFEDGDTLVINDGVGNNKTFTFAVEPTAGQIRIEDIPASEMAAQVFNVIKTVGLKIDFAQVLNTPLITLKHQQRTTRGNITITDSVDAATFFASGLSGGQSGDCDAGKGCKLNSDCASNVCSGTPLTCQ